VVCNYDSLEKNEALTIEFYDKRREDLADKKPNHAHRVVTSLKQKYQDEIAVITQNVDDLFEKAGLSSRDVIHLHGFLPELRCRECDAIFNISYEKLSTFNSGRCPECTSKLRPNIVFFGEAAPKYELLTQHLYSCEFLVIIGTSGNVIEVNHMANAVDISILNNLEPSWMINEKNFTKVIYDKATIAIDAINDEIEKFLSSKH